MERLGSHFDKLSTNGKVTRSGNHVIVEYYKGLSIMLPPARFLMLPLSFAIAVPAQANKADPIPLTQVDIFEKFKALEGRYLEDEMPEKQAKVSYDLWSRDSAVMEVWNMPTKREFTVFHMDQDKLMATHYCGSKMQVTMDLVWPVQNDTYEFRVRYVSSLPSSDAPYNSGFSYRFLDNGDIWRNEKWTTAGKTSVSDLTLIKQSAKED